MRWELFRCGLRRPSEAGNPKVLNIVKWTSRTVEHSQSGFTWFDRIILFVFPECWLIFSLYPHWVEVQHNQDQRGADRMIAFGHQNWLHHQDLRVKSSDLNSTILLQVLAGVWSRFSKPTYRCHSARSHPISLWDWRLTLWWTNIAMENHHF